MMAPDPLDNNRNWVRAAMGLKYLKEGLESFVENEMVNLQTSFLNDICSSHGLPPTTTCSLCNLENALPCQTKGYCYKNRGVCSIHTPGVAYPNCPNKLCNNIAAKVVDQHRHTRRAASGSALNYEAPSWRNTDVSKWCTSPWEIAKCFMAASGYKDKLTVKETDFSGILSVIINCQAIQPALSTIIDPKNDIFHKMRDIRNTIMHSATLELTDAELKKYINGMLAILNDSKTIQNHPDAVTARTKLNQIKANTFIISARDELELRKKAVEDIEQKQKELLEQHVKLKLEVDQTMTSITEAELTAEQKQDSLQSKVDETMTALSQAEFKSQQENKIIQSKVDQAITSFAQAELQSQQKQENLQSKVDEAMTTFTQAELKSQQEHKKLLSKFDQANTSFAQAGLQFQQKQQNLQSKVDEAMTTFTQAELKSQQWQKNIKMTVDQTQAICQQNQKDIQSSQSQLSVTLTSLQTQMKQVLEVMSDLHKGTDKQTEHVKILEKRQQLQTRLREKYLNHQSTIPLIPILKNTNVDIDIVNQKLIIRPDLIRGPNVESHRSINDYEDIFRKKSGLCKNIFVVGNGGVGKTTWCLKLLRTWLNCPNNSKQDHTFLQKFVYLFYIQLRYTKQASQIHEMIRSYIFPELDERCLMDTVDDVLINAPDKCLIILDGLDEWKLPSEQSMLNSGLPYDPTRSRFTTLITSHGNLKYFD